MRRTRLPALPAAAAPRWHRRRRIPAQLPPPPGAARRGHRRSAPSWYSGCRLAGFPPAGGCRSCRPPSFPVRAGRTVSGPWRSCLPGWGQRPPRRPVGLTIPSSGTATASVRSGCPAPGPHSAARGGGRRLPVRRRRRPAASVTQRCLPGRWRPAAPARRYNFRRWTRSAARRPTPPPHRYRRQDPVSVQWWKTGPPPAGGPRHRKRCCSCISER